MSIGVQYSQWTENEKRLGRYLAAKGLIWVQEWLQAERSEADKYAWGCKETTPTAVGWAVVRHLTGAEPIPELVDKYAYRAPNPREELNRLETIKFLAEALEAGEKMQLELDKIQRRISVLAAKYSAL